MSTHVYPYPILTPVIGEPTAETLLVLQAQLYENALSVRKPGSQLGHLGVVMPPAEYLLEPGVVGAFVPPIDPGAWNPGIPGQDLVVHMEQLLQYQRYSDACVSLKAQVIAAIEDSWISALKTQGRLYQTRTVCDIFTYLKTEYGVVSAQQRANNRERLREKWNENEPIGNLWSKVDEVCHFAAFYNHIISNEDKIIDTMKVLLACPKYDRACNTWYDKAPADQTWPNLITHFKDFEKNHKHILTTRQAGYATANMAASDDTTVNETAAAAATARAPPVTPEKNRNNYYLKPGNIVMAWCHTHGLSPDTNHRSWNCPEPGPKHDNKATFWNKNNGSLAVSTKRPAREEWNGPTPSPRNNNNNNRRPRTNPPPQK